MLTVKNVIESGSDLRDWAVDNGWCIDYEIEKLDDLDAWDDLFSTLEDISPEFESETDLNDTIRFGLDDIEFFERYENEEDDEEESEEE